MLPKAVPPSIANPPAMNLPSSPLAVGATAEVYAWGEGCAPKLFNERVESHRLELLATRAAHLAGLPVPGVLGEELVEVEGREGIVFERVDGPTMAEHLEAHPEDLGACGLAWEGARMPVEPRTGVIDAILDGDSHPWLA